MNAVEFHGVSKAYGKQTVLQDVNFAIKENTFSVIFGPPACGKSVLLRLLAGLEKIDDGQVFLRGVEMKRVAAGERNIGYVPQSFALYPHQKVYDNIAYSLKLMGVPKDRIDLVVRQTADLLKISPLLEKRPAQLSGGEKQRVAIARGVVKDTNIFVLDDPLTGLDFKLREHLFDDLKQMQETLQATFIYTTSDPLETLMLADQVIVLDDGGVIEAGTLAQVYANPGHIRTMTLLGFPPASMFNGNLSTQDNQVRCQTEFADFPVQLNDEATSVKDVWVAVRPQDIKLNLEQTSGQITQQAQIVLQEDLGGEQVVYLETNGLSLVSVIPYDDMQQVSNGQVTISIQPDTLILYHTKTGHRIGQGHG